jgi:hypothetical protein
MFFNQPNPQIKSMNYKIEIINTPSSPAETVAGAEALLKLKGVVPLKTLADAFPHLCSFTATMSKLDAYIRERRHIDRTPVIRKSLDSHPGFDQVYRLEFMHDVPQSPAEAIPAPSAGIPSAASVAAAPPAPVQPAQPIIPPAPAPQEGFWTRLRRFFK